MQYMYLFSNITISIIFLKYIITMNHFNYSNIFLSIILLT